MTTVSIRETLGRLPGGYQGKTRTWAQVSDYVYRICIANPNEDRRVKKAAKRQRLYLGCGETDILAMIEEIFKNDSVKDKHRELVPFAKFNNILRRIIQEQASVYSLPAERTVGVAPSRLPNPTAEQELQYDADLEAFHEHNRRYQEVLRLCRFHEVMQRFNALLLLHRAIVIVPRMRQLPTGEWEPTIDLVTPAKFRLVRDPIDPTLCIGILFETSFALADEHAVGPTYELVTWHERAWLNASGRIMEDVPNPNGNGTLSLVEEHNLGRIPAILATLEPPDGQLIDESTGEDLVAAQMCVAFLTVRMIKEAKSATVSTVITGDDSGARRKQPSDSEFAKHLPEGASAERLDESMDFMLFDTAQDRVAVSAAANHGVAPDVYRNSTATSAAARDISRVPLRERRLQQHVPLRQIEFDLAVLLSLIVKQRRPDLAFTTEGWNIDFADPQTPLGSAEALQVLEKELQLGLTSEIRALMDRNPDLTYEQAKQVVLQFIDDRTFRIEAMKRFMIASGGMAQGAMPADAPGDGAIAKPPAEDLSWVAEVMRVA